MLQEQRATSRFDASVSKRGLRIKALRSSSTGAHSGYPIMSIEPRSFANSTLFDVKIERFITKRVHVSIKCMSNHFTMKTRRRRDEQAVQLLSISYALTPVHFFISIRMKLAPSHTATNLTSG